MEIKQLTLCFFEDECEIDQIWWIFIVVKTRVNVKWQSLMHKREGP